MGVKLLTGHRWEFVSLRGGCTCSSESTLVKKQHFRGSIYDILASSRCIRYAGYIHISKKRENSDNYHKSSFSCMQCAFSCSSSLKLFLLFCCCFFKAKKCKKKTVAKTCENDPSNIILQISKVRVDLLHKQV